MLRFTWPVIGMLAVMVITGKNARGQALESVISETNSQRLQELSVRFEEEYLNQRQKARQLAKEYDWPLEYIDQKGNPAYLIGVYPGNIPRYIKPLNADAAATTRTDDLHPGGVTGYGLEGDSMLLGEWDGGVVLGSHQEFGNRVRMGDNASGNSRHATHVAGTMIAAGTNANAKGMAPKADLDAYSFFNDDSEMSTAAGAGLLVSNHSYGPPAGWEFNRSGNNWIWYGSPSIDSTESYLFGWYNSEARSWDQIANNAPYYLIVKAAGNDRSDDLPSNVSSYRLSNGQTSTQARDPDGPYECINGPALAKNVLTVGAVADVLNYQGPDDVTMSSFSGWGPADDGRIKPDLVGNGVSVLSAGINSNSDYVRLSGTSMASPNVSGSLILLQELYKRLHGHFMRAATLKGLAIHTADATGNSTGPDYRYGWGLLNARRAADAIADSTGYFKISENSLPNNDTLTQSLFSNGKQPIRVTIAWNDPAGTVPTSPIHDNTTPVLVNDLDVRLVHKGSNSVYQPYVLSVDTPSLAASTGDNKVDNVEQVYLDQPQAGTYEIRISHKGRLSGGQQRFALLSTGLYGTPTPKFAVAQKNLCQGEMVSFTNLTAGSFSELEWRFPGGTPDTSSQTSPQIRYDSSGVFPVSLTVKNSLGSVTKRRDGYIVVEPADNGVSATLAGRSDNAFGFLANDLQKLQFDPASGVLALVHNNTFTFSGNGGRLAVSYSTDTGRTWTTDVGPLRPGSTLPAAYNEELAIVNPTRSSDTDSVRFLVSAPTFNSNINGWEDYVYGTQPLAPSANASFDNVGANFSTFIPRGLTQGPGTSYWSIDPSGDSTNAISLYSFDFAGGGNLPTVRSQQQFTFHSNPPSGGETAAANLGFGPNPRDGWAVALGRVPNGPRSSARYPVLYHTRDSGKTWQGPITMDLDSLAAVQNLVVDRAYFDTGQDVQMAVDSSGDVHLYFLVTATDTSQRLNRELVSGLIHVHGQPNRWRSRLVETFERPRQRAGSGGQISIGPRPRLSRTGDAEILTFLWIDATGDSLDYRANLRGKSYSVRTGKYSRTYNFTQCQSPVEGQTILPTAGSRLIETDSFVTVPVVTTQPASDNFFQAVRHRYLDSVRFPKSELEFIPPQASFALVDSSLCIGDSLALIEQTEGDVTEWEWVLPGSADTTYRGTTPFARYNSPGTYDVTLVAQGPAGIDSLTQPSALTVNDTPKLTIGPSTYSICSGESLTIKIEAQGNISWTPSTGITLNANTTIQTVLNADQRYQVVASRKGCTSRGQVSVEVIDDEPLQADFGFSQADGCDSLEVQFTDRSFNARTYQWRFEGADTDTSSQANPRVTFTEPGLHGVTLTVGDGCNNTATRELDRLVLVERTPQLRTSFSDTTIQPGDTVRLSASGAENIAWRQASGIIQRDGDALVVAPDTNRRYRVRATTDNCGSDTASVLVRVDATSGLPSAAGAHEGWRVYPNPARQVLYLESTGGQASQQATWRMLSTQGRVVARGQVQPGRRATVRVASLAPGLYFLEWTDPRKTYRQRVVLAR